MIQLLALLPMEHQSIPSPSNLIETAKNVSPNTPTNALQEAMPHTATPPTVSSPTPPTLKDGRVPKPDWLKVRAPGGESYVEIKKTLRELKLYTVCEEARCPNVAECWSGGTATIMLLGDVCTRGCKFCAVKTGNPRGVVDNEEPEKVAGVIAQSGFDYVVLTSVDRDDLADQGSGHFARTVREIKRLKSEILVETLTPDFRGNSDCVDLLVESGVDVFAHNVETVPRLQKTVRDPRAGYEQSLKVLRRAKEKAKSQGRRLFTKTSLMLGLGETYDEITAVMKDLRTNGVDIVTFGQYLQPTARHLKVIEYVKPEAFKHWEVVGKELGFAFVASGPLVRSSYRAGEFFITNLLREESKRSSTDGI